jgi:two-component system cell cycle response regulator DivK
MSQSILLIEDNEKNRHLTTFLLTRHGHKVVTANDGAQGIALALPCDPALILLDIQRPRMDGCEVARALRRIGALRDVAIVAVTSYAMEGDRERALEAGCNGHRETTP